ncbi:uncharacterized protein LOC5565345 [Aedes aegypti]|uniref:Uncharacterized protein n=1 Tax=Aedes aegypti TaxID=7159 RepID=A0A1S4G2P3_AEDAE|nr:uncharacterized protein LOC5565345 [Aedes aegypti]
MMNTVVILAVLCGISAGYSIPAQNAYANFQQPTGFRTVQRTMYGVHFQNFQNEQLRNQRVSDFVPGTHQNDCHHNDVENADWPVQNTNVGSAADAYPSEQFPVEEEPHQDVPAIYEDESEEPIADEPFAAPAVPAVVPASVPEKKKKKVPVQIDSNEEEEQVAQSGRRGAKDSTGSGAFFPINFGSTNGGAIAIANSYSTGKGGSATSTATAYGSPATAELRRNSATQLRRKPSKLRSRQ